MVPFSTASAAPAVIGVSAVADMAAANTVPIIVKVLGLFMDRSPDEPVAPVVRSWVEVLHAGLKDLPSGRLLQPFYFQPLSGAGRCGLRRDGLDVLDDGADLRGLEVVAEARHARRAVADVFPDQLFVAAQGLARQYGSILPRSLLDYSVADAAGLAEKAQSFTLSIVERRIGRRALRKRTR